MTYTARTTAKTVIVVRNTAAVEKRTTPTHFDSMVRCPGGHPHIIGNCFGAGSWPSGRARL